MRQKLLFCFFLCFTLFTQVWAQERTIRGKITDGDTKEPVPGVSVFVKGTSSGTVTDVNGTYSISISGGSVTLVFQAVGMGTREVEVGEQSVIDLTMTTSTKELGEVVVTAVGIEREKKALGYSVATLESGNIIQRSETDPLRSLAGKMPGVNIQGGGGSPGQSTKINIRGFSSLTGNTQPLFVVDGIPFDNSVNQSTGSSGGTQYSNRAFDIDPNNIESISVLKGAAASALYGSRGTNGVVVITTKASKKSTQKGLEVTYNSSLNFEQLSGIPDYQNVYGQGSNQQYNGGFIGNWGAPFAEHVDRLNATYGTGYNKVIVPGYAEGTVPHPLVTTGYAAPRFSNVFPEFFDQNNKAIAVPYKPYDFVKEFFNTGRMIENSINISSGGATSNVNAVVSRMTNEGIIPNSKSSRTTISFGGNSQLANGLFITGNVNYVNTIQQNPQIGSSIFGGNFGTAESSIFTRLFFLPRNYNLLGYPFENPVTGDNVFYRALDNPLWIAKYNIYSSKVNRVFGNLTLSYDVTKWLNLLAKGGINTYSESRRNIVRSGGTSDPNGNVWTDDLTNTEIDLNFIATVSKDINEQFSFRGVVGLNVNERSFDRRFADGDGIISPGLYTVNTTTTQIVRQDSRRLRRFYGAYTDLMFSYKNYLFLNLVGRNDWSSTLPVGKNSYFYPGASVSFVASDAFTMPKFINYTKVRLSAAKVGNDADPYLLFTNYRLGIPFTPTGGQGINRASLSNTLGNANLKPEFTTEYEVGAEIKLFNKVGLDFTYYTRTSTQQITTAATPPASGFTSQVVNAGTIRNRGIEIGLDITPITTKSGFNWNIFAAFTTYKSLVKDAGPSGEILLNDYSGGSLGTIHRAGFPFGQIFGSKNARDENGSILIDRVLGKTIILPDAQIIGDPNPDFTLGITNTLTFKGFTFVALIDWKQGGDIYSTTTGSLTSRGQVTFTEDREALRVIPGVYGNPATFEAIKDGNGNSIENTTPITTFDYFFSNGFGVYGADETNVFDATVVRLRELSLGYMVPKKWLNKTPFGSARLSVSGRNLWFYTPNLVKGINLDPEVLSEVSTSNVQGFENGSAPTTRRYGINLMVTF
jgi:TonB-linked SusC/RagA family outer membrane protein